MRSLYRTLLRTTWIPRTPRFYITPLPCTIPFQPQSTPLQCDHQALNSDGSDLRRCHSKQSNQRAAAPCTLIAQLRNSPLQLQRLLHRKEKTHAATAVNPTGRLPAAQALHPSLPCMKCAWAGADSSPSAALITHPLHALLSSLSGYTNLFGAIDRDVSMICYMESLETWGDRFPASPDRAESRY